MSTARTRPTLPFTLAPTLAAALALAATASSAAAQDIDPSVRPTFRMSDCTVSGCHAATMDHEYLHGPTAVADCRTCHDDVSFADHTFELKREGQALCEFCHIDKSGAEGPFVHKPMAEGDCLVCHDPHGSASRDLTRYASTGELCVSCHTETVHAEYRHEPVKQGDCTACHAAHTADHPALLLQERRSLCLSCHEGLEHAMTNALVTHEPATGDCLECHNSHGSDHAGMIKEDTVSLCTACHQEQLAQAQNATHPHSAVLDDRACLNCHTPHASAEPALQHDDPLAACMACHARPIGQAPGTPHAESAQGAPVASDLADHLPIAHGPVVTGQCAACHEVHGSDHSRLLAANYTDNFYEQFNEHAYELCLACHDRDLLLEDHTIEATRFRDEQINLHALHIKGEQGRTCRACHNTHASTHKAMVRETSPYGQWELPINFKPTEAGGSCSPGCHKAKTYQRNNDPASQAILDKAARDANQDAIENAEQDPAQDPS